MHHPAAHLDQANEFKQQLSLNLKYLRVIQLHEASPKLKSSFGDSFFCVFAFSFRMYVNISFLYQPNLTIYQDCNRLNNLRRDRSNLICA